MRRVGRRIRSTRRAGAAALLAGLAVLFLCRAWARQSAGSSAQKESPTGAIGADFPRLDWQPTRIPAGYRYLGDSVCAACHAAIARTQMVTPMGHASESVADCAILRAHPRLSFHLGPYRWTITREGNASIYSVTDGKNTITVPIAWAFGLGSAGQTYIFLRNGHYQESRVSFFNDTQGLDITLGYPRTPPATLEEAAGRPLGEQEAEACFGCHSTHAITAAGQLQAAALTPGVTCEGCHGPGSAHVAAVQQGQIPFPKPGAPPGPPPPGGYRIFNPGRLSAGDVADFCGSCHRSGVMVQLLHISGVLTVRFQPYRLELSACFDPTDARISCLACHDPHQDVVTDPSFYDAKCLACHRNRGGAPVTGANAPACPVATRQCVTCHMPKFELPGAHFQFTDHYIRIVHPGDRYPG